MTMRPSGPSSPCIRLIQGNERRHGALEDAQKWTYTTCPVNAVRSSRSSALAALAMGDANTGSSAIAAPSAGQRRIGTRFLRLGCADSGIDPVRRGAEHSPFDIDEPGMRLSGVMRGAAVAQAAAASKVTTNQ